MARLDGKQKSPLPLIVGVAVLLLIGAGGYVLMANRGADGIAVQNGSVKIVDTKPGGLLEKSPDAPSMEAQASSTTDSSAATSSTPVPAGTSAEDGNTATSPQDQGASNSATSRPDTAPSQSDTAPSPERAGGENPALASPTAGAVTAETPFAAGTPAPQDSQTTANPAPTAR